jgi:hypothetical protein
MEVTDLMVRLQFLYHPAVHSQIIGRDRTDPMTFQKSPILGLLRGCLIYYPVAWWSKRKSGV